MILSWIGLYKIVLNKFSKINVKLNKQIYYYHYFVYNGPNFHPPSPSNLRIC
jgi:hypothetical protein